MGIIKPIDHVRGAQKFPANLIIRGMVKMKKYFALLMASMFFFCASCTSNNANNNSTTNSTSEAPGIRYQDTDCGFQLDFPSSWEGWYQVDKTSNDSFSVDFVGKSAISQEYQPEFFYIVSQASVDDHDSLLDSIKKIGTVKGINYYYATSTDDSFGPLWEIATSESAANRADDQEIKLAKQDWDQAQGMLKDVDDILKTFGPIK